MISRAYRWPAGLHVSIGRSPRPRAVLWLCLLLTVLAVTLALQLAVEKVTTVEAQCVDMERVIDSNVLVSMKTEELDYLQATLCPSGPEVSRGS